MILTADWHLVDTPSEEYRWNVFNELDAYVKDQGDYYVGILGDLTDRKDRHSAELVNRLVYAFRKLIKDNPGISIVILKGNHDAPLRGTPFWEFLNFIHKDLKFITKPLVECSNIFLPFSASPEQDWPELLKNKELKTAFIHQPVDGAELESGSKYSGAKPLPIPKDIKVFAGDIHTPQTIGKLTYVGAPHPIKFGDHYTCRFIRIDKDSKIIDKHILMPPRKLMLRVSSLEELKETEILPGDQVKLHFTVDANKMQDWPATQQEIVSWSKTAAPGNEAISVVSCEPSVAFETSDKAVEIDAMSTDAEDILSTFIENEGIPDRLATAGLKFLKEAQNARNSA